MYKGKVCSLGVFSRQGRRGFDRDGDGSGGGVVECGQRFSWECEERDKFLYCHVDKGA